MAKSEPSWKVYEHGPLVERSENVWTVDGTLPKLPMPRRMTVVRDSDNTLLVHSPIAVNDETLAQITALGPIRTIVVPSSHHRADAPAYKQRFPDAQVLAPKGARGDVSKVVQVDRTYDACPQSERVRIVHLDGTNEAEGFIDVRDNDGSVLIVNDAVFNMPHTRGVFPYVYGKLLGNFGGPRVTTIFRRFVVRDKRAFADTLERLSRTPKLKMVVVSHGDVLTEEPARILAHLAASI